jgi:hypothetical protein
MDQLWEVRAARYGYTIGRPYCAMVNGMPLRNARNGIRWFKTADAAQWAGVHHANANGYIAVDTRGNNL